MKPVHFRKQSHTEFSKLFSTWCNSKSTWEAWADFVAMSALAISNALDREGPTHDDREKQYLNTIRRYSTAEQQIFPKLLALLVEALEEDPDQDFLGEMFMGLNLGSHWKGQFFTPYNVCRMIAEMQINGIEERVERQGWVSILDPCCGAGALLIAARNVMVRQGLGPTAALYVAQDIDRTAALMCYLQLSLLGCAGYVVVADSLRYPVSGAYSSPLLITPTLEQEIWLTPALYNEVWYGRIQYEHLRLILKNLGVAEFKPEPEVEPIKSPLPEATPKAEPATVPVFSETANGQLLLF